MTAIAATSPDHSPGPWQIDVSDDNEHVICASIGCIAVLAKLEDECQETANARLIATAPELLEHLRNMVEMAHCVAATWESGALVHAVRSLEGLATAAQHAIDKSDCWS